MIKSISLLTIFFLFTIDKLCYSFEVVCVNKFFLKKCTLLIAITEPAFSNEFLVTFPSSFRTAVQKRVNCEKKSSNLYLKWTSKYINYHLDDLYYQLILTKLGMKCKYVDNLLLAKNYNGIRSFKKKSSKNCEYLKVAQKKTLLNRIYQRIRSNLRSYRKNFLNLKKKN
ncbi:Hypothetical protein SRAE_2000512200 [Strongyloides ratti]|uniref:Uncharacterized protein n=1 Tax=Strongyloides ratti TaxID=34506 RepID=A0A090LQN5_STRRB|nr:Hypothetical protein SRAE_2000512200 [Strongyloides ratti]CEF70491.1 Hypothetical protein SRAE_2000512200 [Strongyloides ratti]